MEASRIKELNKGKEMMRTVADNMLINRHTILPLILLQVQVQQLTKMQDLKLINLLPVVGFVHSLVRVSVSVENDYCSVVHLQMNI